MAIGDKVYLILDCQNAEFKRVVEECRKMQAAYYPNNVLSVVQTTDKTKALVKVGGATESEVSEKIFKDKTKRLTELVANDSLKRVLSSEIGKNAEMQIELEKKVWEWYENIDPVAIADGD